MMVQRGRGDRGLQSLADVGCRRSRGGRLHRVRHRRDDKVASADPQTTVMDAPGALDRPGTRLTIRNPDAAKWMPANRQTNPQNRTETTTWVCRPLACAGKSAAVAIQTSPSPTRSPNKTALERVAKLIPAQAKAQDIMMEAASDGDERLTPLTSKVTQVRDYPAILTEMKRTSRGKVNYIYRGDLFIGLFVVRVIAASTERNEAQKNFSAFVSAFEVIDRPPGPPAEAGRGRARLAAGAGGSPWAYAIIARSRGKPGLRRRWPPTCLA